MKHCAKDRNFMMLVFLFCFFEAYTQCILRAFFWLCVKKFTSVGTLGTTCGLIHMTALKRTWNN